MAISLGNMWDFVMCMHHVHCAGLCVRCRIQQDYPKFVNKLMQQWLAGQASKQTGR